MADTSFDLIVLGAGPGGYVAAIRAAQLGMKTAIVERENLGGICLNWGCIPTKALLRTSEINHLLHHLGEFGFAAENPRFEIEKVVKRSRAVAKQLSSGVGYLMKKHKITVFDAEGKLGGQGQARSLPRTAAALPAITAPHIILATGARARELPGIEADGKLIWTYRQAMVPPAMPKSLLVIGSGAIGVEFASFYRDMGAKVTLVEVLDRILPVEDEEISAFARKSFAKQGIEIATGTSVTAVKKGADSVTATIEGGGAKREITVDRVISAIGIVGNVEGIGLEGTGVKVERTHVVIDEFCRTGEPGIYAIGDLVGPPWLAHKAMHEGVLCVEKIAGLNDVASARHHQYPGLHLLPAANRLGRAHRGRGEAPRPRGARRALPLHRQRQGDRAGRAGGDGEDGVRRENRRAPRRAHDRRRGDRAHPGLRHRPDAREHGGRADGDHLPSPDRERDHARGSAGRLRQGAPHLRDRALDASRHPRHF